MVRRNPGNNIVTQEFRLGASLDQNSVICSLENIAIKGVKIKRREFLETELGGLTVVVIMGSPPFYYRSTSP